MSPERRAKELFNSNELRPLANYLTRWKEGLVTDNVDYVQEVCAHYFRLMVGRT